MSDQKQLAALTGLRFIAACGVLICHYAGILQMPATLMFLPDLSGTFVALFFVLSGFVLTLQYDHRLQHRGQLSQYFAARAARVLPVYWLCLIATLFLFLVDGFDNSLGGMLSLTDRIKSFIINFFALQAWIPDYETQQFWNAPGWSVSSEAFFYACFPMLLKACRSSHVKTLIARLWLYMALILGTSFWIIWKVDWVSTSSEFLAFAMLIRFPAFGLYCFVLGVALGIAFNRKTDWPVSVSKITIFLLLVSLVLAAFLRYADMSQMQRFMGQVAAYYLINSIAFAALIWYLASQKSILSCLLGSRSIQILGHASYALYLIHWLPLMWLTAQIRSGAVWTPCEVAMAIGAQIFVSLMIYVWFEDPLRRKLRLWLGPGVVAQG